MKLFSIFLLFLFLSGCGATTKIYNPGAVDLTKLSTIKAGIIGGRAENTMIFTYHPTHIHFSEVIDSEGKTVISSSMFSNFSNMKLPAGKYIFKARCSKGNTYANFEFIKLIAEDEYLVAYCEPDNPNILYQSSFYLKFDKYEDFIKRDNVTVRE